jgi:hypothetical protein
LAAAVTLLPLLVGSSHSALTPPPTGHDIHVSFGRVVVEARTVSIRLRMFQDDLSRALARFHRRDTVDLAGGPAADSLALAYLRRHLTVAVEGRRLDPRLLERGPEGAMWWYLVQYPVGRPGPRLTIGSRVLFEMFDDQQNLLKVVHPASGEETSLYFVPTQPGPVTLTLGR